MSGILVGLLILVIATILFWDDWMTNKYSKNSDSDSRITHLAFWYALIGVPVVYYMSLKELSNYHDTRDFMARIAFILLGLALYILRKTFKIKRDTRDDDRKYDKIVVLILVQNVLSI